MKAYPCCITYNCAEWTTIVDLTQRRSRANASNVVKAFSQNRNRHTHKRTHTGENPFQRSKCDKTFWLTSHILIHHETHTRHKPYQCSQCDKAFNSKDDFVRHQRTHTEKQNTVHIGEKPYKCNQCNKYRTEYCYCVKKLCHNHCIRLTSLQCASIPSDVLMEWLHSRLWVTRIQSCLYYIIVL